MRALGPLAVAEAQRILDREARRLLKARLDADAIGATAGPDDCSLDNRPDQVAPTVDRQLIPVTGADGDGGSGGGE